jgi:hypothetical protein
MKKTNEVISVFLANSGVGNSFYHDFKMKERESISFSEELYQILESNTLTLTFTLEEITDLYENEKDPGNKKYLLTKKEELKEKINFDSQF